MNNSQAKNIAMFALLAALMVATRSNHFDSLTHLPDASLAVFLLAGCYLSFPAFPALLVIAGLTDYFALNYAGVSDWCFSPAYWFLIPTYAVMWYAGRFYAARHSMSWRSLSLFTVTALLATSAAFVISSGSFFLFSGRFPDMTALQYADSVAKYFAPYLGSSFLYLSIAVCIQSAAENIFRRTTHA